MNLIMKALTPFINDLKALHVQEHHDASNMKKISSILQSWVKQSDWLEDQFKIVDTPEGFKSWLLYEEPNHCLAVNLVAWEPGREILPHDHRTWAVVGCVRGIEENYFWTRLDDGSSPGYADLKRQEPPITCHPGEVIAIEANQIHSVVNVANEVAISLHVYGKNLNYTNRCKYDPIKKTAEPFVIDFN
ncbi:cupin [Legionella gresilensis]|uniref:cysteine dioxygenase family protein n=1 Tax=Legionella gresilensis TaxID=91823 RepID=UPI0010415A20|nr:cupin [Legionella gresilensis]